MGRLREWWDRMSPRKRWERSFARRRELLASISLESADRAAALILGGEPVLPLGEDEAHGALHPYTAAFLRTHEAAIAGNEDECYEFGRDARAAHAIEEIDVLAVDAEPHEPPVLWTSRAGELEVDIGVRGGNWRSGLRSVAHAVLEVSLADHEIAALAREPASWRPVLEHHPPLRVLPPPASLEVDVRSRAWALVGSALVAPLAGLVAAVLVIQVVSGRADLGVLCPAIVAAFLALLNARRFYEVVWLEPRVRRWRPDDEGVVHPRTGAPIAWRDCRDLSLRWGSILLSAPGGTRLVIPRSYFREPDRAVVYLRARVGRSGAGPFRQPA